MKLPRRRFLHLAAGWRRCSGMGAHALSRSIIRHGRCGSSSAPSPAARPMSAPGWWPIGCRGGSAKRFFVENRNGASGNLAAEAVADAPPDGYTLLLVSASNAINATLYNDLKFNVLRDFAPVAGVVGFPDGDDRQRTVPGEEPS